MADMSINRPSNLSTSGLAGNSSSNASLSGGIDPFAAKQHDQTSFSLGAQLGLPSTPSNSCGDLKAIASMSLKEACGELHPNTVKGLFGFARS